SAERDESRIQGVIAEVLGSNWVANRPSPSASREEIGAMPTACGVFTKASTPVCQTVSGGLGRSRRRAAERQRALSLEKRAGGMSRRKGNPDRLKASTNTEECVSGQAVSVRASGGGLLPDAAGCGSAADSAPAWNPNLCRAVLR